MKNLLTLVIAILGLAFFASCEDKTATEQTQQEQQEVTEQQETQEMIQEVDSMDMEMDTAVDSIQ